MKAVSLRALLIQVVVKQMRSTDRRYRSLRALLIQVVVKLCCCNRRTYARLRALLIQVVVKQYWNDLKLNTV